jgi:Rieske Fe-S protein
MLIFIIGTLCFEMQCKRNTVTESIPTGPVNLTIDLNLPSNVHLNTVGNYSYFAGGIKGVLVIHDYDDNWYAYERTCSFQPLDPCAVIWIDSANLQMKCGTYSGNQFSACCQSSFIFSGFPVKGPAKGRLSQYKIQKNSNLLYVYN